MKGGFDRSKSLQEIEQCDWGEPTYHSSLVITCHRLRRKPLRDFTVGDLRIMIGQQISLPILVPLALERLEIDPMCEGTYYPGDLLSAVLVPDQAFWDNHADSRQRIRRVLDQFRQLRPLLDEIVGPSIDRVLAKAPPYLTSPA